MVSPSSMVRVYSDMNHFQRDSAAVAAFGWYPVSVQQSSSTNGCMLAILLIVGLLLTPVCIGIALLCCIPLVVGRRAITVVYQSNPALAPIGAPVPVTRQLSTRPVSYETSPLDRLMVWAKAQYLTAYHELDTYVATRIPSSTLRIAVYIAVLVLIIATGASIGLLLA